MKNSPVIKCEDLAVTYGRNQVLGPLSIDIPSNTKIAILGPNGAGKSTLLKAVAGLIHYRGKITSNYNSCSYTAQRQEVDWNFPITCRSVVEIGLYRKVGWFRRLSKDDKQQASDALARLQMADFAEVSIRNLSIGQQQRVFLARAIVDKSSDLFMFDEPLAGVDAKTEKIIYKILDELIAKGKSVICVHHNLYDVVKYFDYAILINKELVSSGPIEKSVTRINLRNAYKIDMGIPNLR